ncbi:MAG TPA: hypothetical protein EYG89_05260 [Bacteroidia bacterium]|nr:hypothetical protein [Bacteroidia bacterium]
MGKDLSHHEKSGDKFYSFDDIKDIKMNSKSFNGHLKLKSQKKKVILDSVAIDLYDQKQIAETVNNYILK